MKLFETPIVLLFLAVLVVLHFVSLITKGKIAKISNYVNIFLHIVLFIPMLMNKFSIEEAVLVYMISFFIYTLFALIIYRASVGANAKVQAARERFLARKSSGKDKEEDSV